MKCVFEFAKKVLASFRAKEFVWKFISLKRLLSGSAESFFKM